jgi:hypothetical protein
MIQYSLIAHHHLLDGKSCTCTAVRREGEGETERERDELDREFMLFSFEVS